MAKQRKYKRLKKRTGAWKKLENPKTPEDESDGNISRCYK